MAHVQSPIVKKVRSLSSNELGDIIVTLYETENSRTKKKMDYLLKRDKNHKTIFCKECDEYHYKGKMNHTYKDAWGKINSV